jgi:septal ring factor EnvC (AmiA/AmiB activator)
MRWLLALLVCCSTLATAQGVEERLRTQQAELQRIRRERDSLEAEMRRIQGRVHTLSEEVNNVHAQVEATRRLVASLDRQLAGLNADIRAVNEDLARTEAEVQLRRATLRRRVRDIYKRGPLYATEALLSARSFGELVARYKYLHELALYDRALVERVEELYRRIEGQRRLLVQLQEELSRNRAEKLREEERLRQLEQQRQRALAQVQRSAQQLQSRLQQIQRDEARLAQVIAALEAERRRAAAGAPNEPGVGTSTLKTSDFGRLDWPVQGEIIYNFGRAVNPNNTTIRWNGIGIKAPLGAPVRSIAAGEVMLAEPLGTYGITVIVQHGGGDYSVYGSLQRAAVSKGTKVAKGDVIGYVGQADPDMDPHLHFEIRPKGRATDPLAWLRERRP